MYHAATIANAFVALSKRDGRVFHPIQLNKLVYFAHGWHLAYHGTPLIAETVQAWRFGPTIRSLYRAMNARRYQLGERVTSPNPRYLFDNDPDPDAQRLIEAVYARLCQYSGAQMATYARQNSGDMRTPWARAWEKAPPDEAFVDIPKSIIREFFTHLKEHADGLATDRESDAANASRDANTILRSLA